MNKFLVLQILHCIRLLIEKGDINGAIETLDDLVEHFHEHEL